MVVVELTTSFGISPNQPRRSQAGGESDESGCRRRLIILREGVRPSTSPAATSMRGLVGLDARLPADDEVDDCNLPRTLRRLASCESGPPPVVVCATLAAKSRSRTEPASRRRNDWPGCLVSQARTPPMAATRALPPSSSKNMSSSDEAAEVAVIPSMIRLLPTSFSMRATSNACL